jgi:hypothetical protein
MRWVPVRWALTLWLLLLLLLPVISGMQARLSLIPALERVLMALVVRMPSIGYTQGMNYVLGVLLMELSEEDSFWVMASIVDDHFAEFYSASLSGTQVNRGASRSGCTTRPGAMLI